MPRMPARSALRTDLLLLLTAAIWGFAFAAQRAGMESVGPFTYNAVRFALGAASLVPLLLRRRARARRAVRANLWPAVIAGVLLFGGSTLQQIGIVYTTAGKAGFITGLYVVLVPLFGGLFGRQTGAGRWVGAVLAAAGLYFLSVTGAMQLARGDVLVALCALFFTAHVLALARVSPRMDPILLSVTQYAVTAIVSAVGAFVFEQPDLTGVIAAWLPIVYGGVFSVGVAYSLQVVAQKKAHPAHAAIILSLEGVFAAVGGYLLLGETLSQRSLLGAALMLAAMLVSQGSALRARFTA